MKFDQAVGAGGGRRWSAPEKEDLQVDSALPTLGSSRRVPALHDECEAHGTWVELTVNGNGALQDLGFSGPFRDFEAAARSARLLRNFTGSADQSFGTLQRGVYPGLFLIVEVKGLELTPRAIGQAKDLMTCVRHVLSDLRSQGSNGERLERALHHLHNAGGDVRAKRIGDPPPAPGFFSKFLKSHGKGELAVAICHLLPEGLRRVEERMRVVEQVAQITHDNGLGGMNVQEFEYTIFGAKSDEFALTKRPIAAKIAAPSTTIKNPGE